MSVYVVAHNPLPPDPTMTVDNVTQVLSKIPGDEWEGMMSGVGGKPSRALIAELAQNQRMAVVSCPRTVLN